MAYATIADVQARLLRTLSEDEQNVVSSLLEDAAGLIDAYNSEASENAKKIVSCRMVIRAIGNTESEMPIGATQGSMSALGYSQSWTIGNDGGTAELYIGKTEKTLLGVSNSIGSYSPIQELVRKAGES